MPSPPLVSGSSSLGGAAAQTPLQIMTNSMGCEDNWLLSEISGFDVPVKSRSEIIV
jgi:hypothetical protein